jgi:hypothetical protein
VKRTFILAFVFSCGSAPEDMPLPDSGTPPPMGSDVLALATMTIPRGTTVREFDFRADGPAPTASTIGATLVVTVLDASHPNRDQSAICPNDHPLDGCPTVDYGAFGDTHDNRITLMSASGPIAFHLYKDRSIEPDAEPLAPFE